MTARDVLARHLERILDTLGLPGAARVRLDIGPLTADQVAAVAAKLGAPATAIQAGELARTIVTISLIDPPAIVQLSTGVTVGRHGA